VKITLFEDYSETLLGRLAAGEIDFIAGSDDGTRDQQLLRTPLYTCGDVIIARAQHPLAGKKNLTLADLQPFTWMVPYSRPSDARAIARAYDEAHLAPPSRFIWTDAPMVGVQLLLQDDYVIMTSPAMVPMAFSDGTGDIVKLDIHEPSVERRASLTYRAATKLNPSAMLLMELIEASAQQYIADTREAAKIDLKPVSDAA
jgi:LysR family transcriptional regulator of gallate degradation